MCFCVNCNFKANFHSVNVQRPLANKWASPHQRSSIFSLQWKKLSINVNSKWWKTQKNERKWNHGSYQQSVVIEKENILWSCYSCYQEGVGIEKENILDLATVAINKALLLKKKTFLILLQLYQEIVVIEKENILDLARAAINKALLLKKKTFLILLQLLLIYRSSRAEVFCRKGVLRSFEKFTGKYLCQVLFFNNVLLKKRL